MQPHLIKMLLVLMVCQPLILFATPDMSPAIKQVLTKQLSRARNNDNAILPFIKDLTPEAKSGDPIAQYFLAVMVPGNHISSKQRSAYLHRSASLGCAGSAGALSKLYTLKKQYKVALQWLDYAAKAGDAGSQYLYANHFLQGSIGLDRDKLQGYAWLLLANDQAFSNSLYTKIQQQLIYLKQANSLTKKQIQHGTLYYEVIKSKYGVKAFHACGQSIPGNDRKN